MFWRNHKTINTFSSKGADKNKKITIRAEKRGDDNASAQSYVRKKLRQRVIYRGNSGTAPVKNQVKGVDENRSKQRIEILPARQKK